MIVGSHRQFQIVAWAFPDDICWMLIVIWFCILLEFLDYRRRLRRVIAAPPNTRPPDAEANIQKNPVKNVLKKVAKHDFSGIGATVEKNTENDAESQARHVNVGVQFLSHLGTSRQRKTNIFFGEGFRSSVF